MPIFLFDKIEMTHRAYVMTCKIEIIVVVLQLSLAYTLYFLCVSFVSIVCESYCFTM